MPLCQCNFFSKSLNNMTNLLVYLPMPGRSDCSKMSLEEIFPSGKKFKTLYLLHGMYGDETVWIRKSNVERYAELKQIALVMLSVQNSFYSDMDIGLHYYTYLTEELPRFCQFYFPLSSKREDNFIAGLSMGGYGACKAALSKPDQYAAFASLSGSMDIEEVYRLASTDEELRLFSSTFGPHENFSGSSHDLFSLSSRLLKSQTTLPKAYLACGTEDKLCYSMNTSFRNHLQKIGFPFTYEEAKGEHNWDFWDPFIKRVLDWLPLSESETT